MGKYTVYVCENCGMETKQENNSQPDDWATVSIRMNEYTNYMKYYKHMLICRECAEKAGMVLKDNEEIETKEETQTIQNRLYDVVTEIIRNEIQ